MLKTALSLLLTNSNTTYVNVKLLYAAKIAVQGPNSNTTYVNVKPVGNKKEKCFQVNSNTTYVNVKQYRRKAMALANPLFKYNLC